MSQRHCQAATMRRAGDEAAAAAAEVVVAAAGGDGRADAAEDSGAEMVTVEDFERYALRHLPKNARDYYASGADAEVSLRLATSAFSQRFRLLPRVLRDVSSVDMRTTVLGVPVSSPLCVAPTAMHRMAHPDGELATARATARADTLMGLSSLSTTPLEEVARASQGPKWFQLYVFKDRSVALDLVRRAESAGFLAIAVTVDAPMLGRREADVRNRFKLPPHLTLANFTGYHGKAKTGMNEGAEKDSGLADYFVSLMDASLSWDDIAWLRKQTRLPIIVKGIMTVEDALLAVEHRVDAIWVSNHGGRQLDTVPATIEVLAEICRAVSGEVEVYLDGGVRRGTDILKAVALGARAVFIGRPVLWGLAHSGEDGVGRILKMLQDELRLAMRLVGAKDIASIDRSMVADCTTLVSRL